MLDKLRKEHQPMTNKQTNKQTNERTIRGSL